LWLLLLFLFSSVRLCWLSITIILVSLESNRDNVATSGSSGMLKLNAFRGVEDWYFLLTFFWWRLGLLTEEYEPPLALGLLTDGESRGDAANLIMVERWLLTVLVDIVMLSYGWVIVWRAPTLMVGGSTLPPFSTHAQKCSTIDCRVVQQVSFLQIFAKGDRVISFWKEMREGIQPPAIKALRSMLTFFLSFLRSLLVSIGRWSQQIP
jgi:hypothetical protein